MHLAYTIRVLRKNRLVTGSIVVILGLAIAACVSMFTFVNAILLKPLGYEDAEQLVRVRWANPMKSATFLYPTVSAADLNDVHERSRYLRSFAFYIPTPFNLLTRSEPEIIPGVRVSREFFKTLGVSPALGRAFREEEDLPGKNAVAIIGAGLWERSFGRADDIIGKRITLAGRPVEIVGVMPKGFQFPSAAEVYVPAGVSREELTVKRENRTVFALARMVDGATIEKVNNELEVISKTLQAQFPVTNAGVHLRALTLLEDTVGNVRVGLYVMFAAVLLLLLLACANVASLLLGVTMTRQKEYCLRIALGSGVGPIVRQCITESLFLGGLAAAVGLVMSLFLVRFLVAIAPSNIPRLENVALDWRALVFAIFISLLASLTFGLFPGWYLTRQRLTEVLNDGGKGVSSGARKSHARNVLIVVEVAMAFTILVAAGLMMKSFMRLNRVEPGFNAHNLIASEVALPWEKYSNPTNRAAFYKGVVNQFREMAGGYSAGFVSMLPLDGRGLQITVRPEGAPVPEKGREDYARYNPVGGDYHKTMGIPLIDGRLFDENDTFDRSKVVIVNQAFAARTFPGDRAVGKRLHVEGQKELFEIIGVIGNVRQKSKTIPTEPELNFHFLQVNDPTMTLVVRGPSSSIVAEGGAAIRRAINVMDAQQAAGKIVSMERLVGASTAQAQFRASILSVLAICALALASVGLYGIISYLVEQRTPELGVRMALGAEPSVIKRMIVQQGLKLLAVGLLIGLALTLGLSVYLKHALFDVSAYDPSIYIGLAAGFAGLAFLASYIPAVRATRIDPVSAWRNA